MSKSRQILEEIAASGKYLFHGSPYKLKQVEPRQAYNRGRPDGKPAVATIDLIDPAIFISLIPKDSGWSANGNDWHFYASFDALEKAKAATGYVYVFEKNTEFKLYKRSREWRAYRIVTPAKVVEVHYEDLPADIKIKNLSALP